MESPHGGPASNSGSDGKPIGCVSDNWGRDRRPVDGVASDLESDGRRPALEHTPCWHPQTNGERMLDHGRTDRVAAKIDGSLPLNRTCSLLNVVHMIRPGKMNESSPVHSNVLTLYSRPLPLFSSSLGLCWRWAFGFWRSAFGLFDFLTLRYI